MVADVPQHVSWRRLPGSNMLSYYVIITLCYYHLYMYLYVYISIYTCNRVTSNGIDLSKIKLFVFVFVIVDR